MALSSCLLCMAMESVCAAFVGSQLMSRSSSEFDADELLEVIARVAPAAAVADAEVALAAEDQRAVDGDRLAHPLPGRSVLPRAVEVLTCTAAGQMSPTGTAS